MYWFCCCQSLVRPAEPTAQQLAHRVDKYYNGLHSLRTAFTESFHGMGIDREESGTLLLRKPGKMHWSYTQSSGQGLSARWQIRLVLFAWRCPSRTRGRHAIGRSALTTALPAGPHATAEGTRRVDAVHHRRWTAALRSAQGNAQPGGEDCPGGERRGVIHSMVIDETDGARTSFTFKESQADAPAPNSDFVFHPPPGVPVVDGLPPV